MQTIRVKGVVPIAIERHKGTAEQHIYDSWKNQPLEPYGKVLKGRGDKAPYDRDHIAVRLAIPGVSACCVVALDEIEGPIDLTNLPKMPSCCGQPSSGYDGYGNRCE